MFRCFSREWPKGIGHLEAVPYSGGPAAGPMHNNVLEGHMDYWRDETSALGANPDAYFPKPYAQFLGENAKNYGRPNRSPYTKCCLFEA